VRADQSSGHGRIVPVNDVPRHAAASAWTYDLPTPSSALAVGAHPDDIDFGAGATLGKWAAAGCTVHYLILTDGARGAWDPSVELRILVERREREQQEAARRIGAATVHFCQWPDGELANGRHQRWVVSRAVRRLRPAVVLGHDPWRRYRLHPDHRVAGFLLTDALVAARDPLFFPDQSATPHRPDSLLLWEADEPNHLESAGTFGPTKVQALLAHRSQYRNTMGIDDHDQELGPDDPGASSFRARIESQLAEHGAVAGAGPGEAFRLIEDL
jgi:LmbE family N-acetylglucosaminyl deacetylase